MFRQRKGRQWRLAIGKSNRIIEAIHMPKAQRFTVGVQWHAEWKAQEHELARKLFRAFGEAAHEYAEAK